MGELSWVRERRGPDMAMLTRTCGDVDLRDGRVPYARLCQGHVGLCRAEGPAVRPAQANGLGKWTPIVCVGPTGQRFMLRTAARARVPRKRLARWADNRFPSGLVSPGRWPGLSEPVPLRGTKAIRLLEKTGKQNDSSVVRLFGKSGWSRHLSGESRTSAVPAGVS